MDVQKYKHEQICARMKLDINLPCVEGSVIFVRNKFEALRGFDQTKRMSKNCFDFYITDQMNL